jgi:hypothetical protein
MMPATTSKRHGRHRLVLLLTAGICVVVIAGCGSSEHKPSAASNAGSFLAFSECMRSHGVSDFPDPSADGGINIAGTGVDPSSPAVRAAQATCKKVLPGGGPPPHASEQQEQHLVAISACMRRHGVPGFPDPTTTSPPSNPQDYSIVEGIGDVFLLVPSTINVNSPAFENAAKTCDFH